VGLHTGKFSRVTVSPAGGDQGLVCSIGNKTSSSAARATWDRRVPSLMSTTLRLADGQRLRTVEHMLASFAAFGVDNAFIEVDGNEIPILDGSAALWCAALESAGIVIQDRVSRIIEIQRPIQVTRDGGFVRGEPADGFFVDVTFDNLPGFGLMRWAGQVDQETFVAEIARARSFGRPSWKWLERIFPFEHHVRNAPGSNKPESRLAGAKEIWDEMERQNDKAPGDQPVLRGAWPGRVAVVLGPWILGGRRFPDEPVRHVVLDLLGDLALAGGAIKGRITAHVPSHEKNYAFVATLMRDVAGQENSEGL